MFSFHAGFNWRTRLILVALWCAVGIGVFVRLCGIARSVPGGLGTPLWDDAYYYFTLGQHLAAGQGPRADDLNLTTGFQPLWGFISTLVFWVSPVGGVPLMQLMGLLVGVVALPAIYHIALEIIQKTSLALFVAAFWWLLPQTFLHNLGGMETSLAVTAVFYAWWAFLRLYRSPTEVNARWFGLACGVATLTRVDFIVLDAVFALCLLRVLPSVIRWRIVLNVALVGAFTLLPWVLFTWSFRLSPIPESGAAVRALAEYTRFDLSPLRQILTFLIAWDGVVFALPGFAVSLLVVLLLVSRRYSSVTRLIFWAFGVWFLGTLLAYALAVPAHWFYGRYAMPTAQFFGVLAMSLLLKVMVSRKRLSSPLASGVLFALFLPTLVIGYLPSSMNWLYTGIPTNGAYYDAAMWINNHTEADARIGAFQSGLIGFYADRVVINLDGKVNADAREALVEGRSWQYLCSEEIDYFVDWPSMVAMLVDRSTGWQSDNLELLVNLPGHHSGFSMEAYRVNKARC